VPTSTAAPAAAGRMLPVSSVRGLRSSDVDAVEALLRPHAGSAYRGMPADLDRWLAGVAQTATLGTVVLDADGVICGACLLTPAPRGDDFTLRALWVDPLVRRRGLGMALLTALELIWARHPVAIAVPAHADRDALRAVVAPFGFTLSPTRSTADLEVLRTPRIRRLTGRQYLSAYTRRAAAPVRT
jgi:GNAT superfamily N-acetyltransferase